MVFKLHHKVLTSYIVFLADFHVLSDFIKLKMVIGFFSIVFLINMIQ